MCSVKVLSGILIYLYRSCCPICKQLYPGLPLKNSIQTTLYAFQKFYIISDQQYVIHIHLSKCCSAPTHFLANTSFLQTLYKPKCFDHLIKAYVPTPRCLLQSIEGPLEFAYLLASLRSTKPSGCITYSLSSRKPSRKLCFDIHLPYFINENAATANIILTDFSIAMIEKVSSQQLLELVGNFLE